MKHSHHIATITLVMMAQTLVTCSEKPTEQTGITQRIETTTAVVNSGADTTIGSNDYRIYIPANAVSDSTFVTIQEDTLLSVLAEGDFETVSLGLSVTIEGSILDTIYLKLPDLSVSNPHHYVILYQLSDSSYRALPATSDSGQLTVSYPPGDSLITARRIDPVTRFVVRIVEGSLKLIQPRGLYTATDGVLQEFNQDWSGTNEKIAVLVHGITAQPSRFLEDGGEGMSLSEYAQNQYNGRVVLYQYPSGDKVSENASWLFQELDARILSKNSNIQIDLYGHSMGGVLCRKVVFDHPSHFESLVTFGSPHDGVTLAQIVDALEKVIESDVTPELSVDFAPFTAGAQELRPNSDLLTSMNQSELPVPARYLTVYGITPQLLHGEENDGFIFAYSANMNHGSFPSMHEIPTVLNSYKLAQSHGNLIYNRDGLFNRIDEFVSNKTGAPPVTDIDGNVYQTVEIGSQVWMAENLRVKHFSNGDAIPFATVASDWTAATAAVVGDPGFDSAKTEIYGLFYNGYAARDSRSLAPEGWRVATDEDWKTLEAYIGMGQSQLDEVGWRGSPVGGKLKETGLTLWNGTNTGATNSTGFSGLPAGYLNLTATHVEEYVSAHFWTSSGSDYYRVLRNDQDGVWRQRASPAHAYSIRCVKE